MSTVLPSTVSGWSTLVRAALQPRVEKLFVPDHFFLTDIASGRRFLPMHMPQSGEQPVNSAVLVLLSPPACATAAAQAGGGIQEMCVTLTKRGAALRRHGGQMAFPGGRLDAGESPVAAAQREAAEEVGIAAEAYEVIGQLQPVRVPASSAASAPSSSADSSDKASTNVSSAAKAPAVIVPVVAVARAPVVPTCRSRAEVAAVKYLHLSRLLLAGGCTHCRVVKRTSMAAAAPSHFPCFFAADSQSEGSADVRASPDALPMPEDCGLEPMLPRDFPGELVWGITAFITCELIVRLAAELERRDPQRVSARQLLAGSHIVARDPDTQLTGKQ